MTRYYAAAAALTLALLLGGTAAWTLLKRPPDCGGNAVAGASAIGGPFELVDASGREVTDRDVITGPTLIYFGYTFCPDVCPMDVSRNALAVDILAGEGIEATPVFISVDPARDTPETVGDFAAAMHPSMVGLTGSEEQVRDAANAYRAFFSRGAAEDGYYLVDHSTFTYLMFPGTGLATYFGRSESPEEMARQVACHAAARGGRD